MHDDMYLQNEDLSVCPP